MEELRHGVYRFFIFTWHHASWSMRSWESALVGKAGPGKDSQDRMDQISIVAGTG
jgi:hypothetical protein